MTSGQPSVEALAAVAGAPPDIGPDTGPASAVPDAGALTALALQALGAATDAKSARAMVVRELQAAKTEATAAF